jgi:hypothetical protein
MLRINNDDNISEDQATRALQILGCNDRAEIRRQLDAANGAGSMTLGPYPYREIAKRLQDLEEYEREQRIDFTGNFLWKNMEPCHPPSGGGGAGSSAGAGSSTTDLAIQSY